MKVNKSHVAILGSTGSIGVQALEVIKSHPNYFVVEILTANNNSNLLISQAKEFNPNIVVIKNSEKYDEVIIPDLTWISTASSIIFVGAKPVLADLGSVVLQ